MNNTNMNSNTNNQNFWQTLAELGKNILAHVNISYNGAEGVIHIDIIPVKNNEIVVEDKVVIEQKENPMMIEGGKQNKKSASNVRKSDLKKEGRNNDKRIHRRQAESGKGGI